MSAPRSKRDLEIRRILEPVELAARGALLAPLTALLTASEMIVETPLERNRLRGPAVAKDLWALGLACGRHEEVRARLNAAAEACTAGADELRRGLLDQPEPHRIPERIDRAGRTTRIGMLVQEADDFRRAASLPVGPEAARRAVWAHRHAQPVLIEGLGAVAADYRPELVRDAIATAARLAGDPDRLAERIARSGVEPFRQAGRLARHRRGLHEPGPLLEDPFAAHLLTRAAVDRLLGVVATPVARPARTGSLRQALTG